MPPAVIPNPMNNWQKWAISLGATPTSFLVDLLDYAGNEADPEDMIWMRLVVHFANTVSSDPRDDAICTFDFANVTGGALDTTWNTSDFTTVETAFNTALSNVKGYMNSSTTVDQYLWYKRRFNAMSSPKPYAATGPPVRVTPVTYVGTGTGNQIPQAALAITEKTAWPHHWGRFYLPAIIPGLVAPGGRYTSTVSTILSYFATAYTACGSAELFPCVPVTQVDKAPARLLLGVQKLQVDDVPDVIRRRRPYSAGTKYVLP